jgi:CRISPR-associated endonuclease/helicase Cas3
MTALTRVTLLESETGSGKTEAALMHMLSLFRDGKIGGAYFALPTRTSGVQIHGRVTRFLRAAFGEAAPPCVLAVPGYMRVDDHNGAMLGPFQVRWDDGATFSPRGWAAEHAKRYLAAPFAVGTIDQALMAVVRSKHAHMRAACLTRNLLIIDEVHASDTYMTELAIELVRRQVAAGGYAFLMSATLGAEVAVRYVGGRNLSLAEASVLRYPLIRCGEPGLAEPLRVLPAKNGIIGDNLDAGRRAHGSGKTVTIEMSPTIAEPLAVARRAADYALAGARVLVVRNSVDGCVKVRRLLAGMLPPEMQFSLAGVAAPHHGRFAAEDRRLLDERVGDVFGRGSPSGGMVLVATQTVEQSLDIDADVLITDICPMDVLLQRIGRLFRHARPDRPERFREARCVVLVPDVGLTALASRNGQAHGIGLGRAYEDVRIVELTRRALAAQPVLRVPEMNRMLVEACVHSEAKRSLDAEDAVWARHGQDVGGVAGADRGTAREAIVVTDKPFGDAVQFQAWLDERAVSTRLGASSVSAVFPGDAPPRSPFGGHAIPIVNIPDWMAPKGILARVDEPTPAVIRQSSAGFAFSFADATYEYDCDGLRKL